MDVSTDRAGGKTILCVDDSPPLRDYLARRLRRMGFTVVTAGSGVEGRACLGQCEPDVVVLDVDMPEMDGLEFLELLRSESRFADLPVILLTGNIDSQSVQRGRELGVQDHIVKSYHSVEQIVQRVLSRLGHATPCPAPARTA